VNEAVIQAAGALHRAGDDDNDAHFMRVLERKSKRHHPQEYAL